MAASPINTACSTVQSLSLSCTLFTVRGNGGRRSQCPFVGSIFIIWEHVVASEWVFLPGASLCCCKWSTEMSSIQMFTYDFSSLCITISFLFLCSLLLINLWIHPVHLPLPLPHTQSNTGSTRSHWLTVTSLVQSVESDCRSLSLTTDALLRPQRTLQVISSL